MKFSIIILLVLGIVAAGCAALLMGILKIDTPASAQSKGIEVAMANVSLPAMTAITQEHIDKENVSRNELPKGILVNPISVIGRVLAVPVFQGQILTETCFVAEGSGAHLAAQIPHGMRALTVPVSSKSMPDRNLLYPGCVVDVLVSYRLSGRYSEGNAFSGTMLREIQVLAIGNETVITNSENGENGNKQKSGKRGTLVTLLVDTKQAEGLQLAVDNGTISLSIRNPLDKKEFETEGSVLNQDRLAQRGDVLEPTVQPLVENASKLLQDDPNQPGQESKSDNPQKKDTQMTIPGIVLPGQENKQSGNTRFRKSFRWPVEVLRGREKTVEEFEAEESESGKIAPKK